MANITHTRLPEPLVQYGPTELEAGTFYITAEGELVYAAARTVVVNMSADGAFRVMMTGANRNDAMAARFPFTRAPVGTSVTITQEPLLDDQTL